MKLFPIAVEARVASLPPCAVLDDREFELSRDEIAAHCDRCSCREVTSRVHRDRIFLLFCDLQCRLFVITSNKPIRIEFTHGNIPELVNDRNTTLVGSIAQTLDEKKEFCSWRVIMDGVTALVSKPL